MDIAMKNWVDPCNNFVFADTKGSIQYLNRGKIPVRPKENVWLPVPGWTGENEWDGYIPHNDLPRITNPSSGFIITANQNFEVKQITKDNIVLEDQHGEITVDQSVHILNKESLLNAI